MKALVRFPAWIIVRRRLPRTPLSRPALPEGVKPASIATYFPNIDMAAAKNGRFRSRYWEKLHDALQPADGKPNRVNWVFLYFPAPQCSFPDAIKLRDRFRANGQDGASFHFLEEFLTNAGPCPVQQATGAVEPAGRGTVPFPRFPDGSLARPERQLGDSTRGWRALNAASCAKPSAAMRNGPGRRSGRPSRRKTARGNVYALPVHARRGCRAGLRRAAPRCAPRTSLYFDDPAINDPSRRRAMPELWLCTGPAQDALLAGHMPEDRTALVEALRYLYLAPKPDAEAAPETPAKPTRLLIVTSFFADETDAHLATLAASAKAGTLDGWEVVVKPHPYLPVVERLKNLYGGAEPPSVVDGPIGNFLTPGTVVWASNSTTVALEAAFRKLPVLVQAAEDDVDLCPLQGLPGVVNVRTVSDVAAALAAPKAPDLPPDYLALDPELPRWKERLGL